MDEWYKPKSNVRVILGLIFIITGFIWMIFFYNYMSITYPRTTPAILIGWLGAIITSFLFFLGICVGFSVKTKKVVVATSILFVWSLGFLVLPVPEGYAEAVYGSWVLILMVAIGLYAKYEESKKKKARLEKETGKK